MLTVFGDESVDSAGKKVFGTAGLLGDINQWRALREKWSRRLNGKKFQATDCECDQIEDTPHAENLDSSKELTKIVARSRPAAAARREEKTRLLRC
jgi:hypothetical protein